MHKFLSSAVLFSLLPGLLLPGRGDTILEGNFDHPLSTEIWNIFPRDSFQTVEGQLVMNAANPDPSAYAVLGAVTATPLSDLNFTSHTVTIKLGDLSFKGSAAPDLQVFIVSLFSDKRAVPADHSIKFRFSGDGELMIGVADTNEANRKQLLEMKLQLPVKSATFTLDANELKVAVEDAGGSKSQEVALDAASLAPWQGVSPYFGLETHRSPGTGDAQVTLGQLSVDSAASASNP